MIDTLTPSKKRLDPRLQFVKPSATLRINERSQQLVDAGQTVYRLGFGQSPFPVPASVREALQANAHQKDYLPVKGLPALRAAVAGFHRRTLEMDCEARQVMIGPGSKELIFSLQMVLDADLLLPSPSWVSYEPQANLLGRKTWWIDTLEAKDWRLTPDALDDICQKTTNPNKLLILNYPNNPTGTTYSENDLHQLAEVLRQHSVIVLADEIYGEVSHTHAHSSLAQVYAEATILSGGLSKWCGAGGWRLGTFLFPKELLYIQDAMATVASETFSAVSAPIQYAAITAFDGNDEIQSYLKGSNQILHWIGKYVHKHLTAPRTDDFSRRGISDTTAKVVGTGITMPAPEGGFYLFPNFNAYKNIFQQKNIYDSEAMCEYILTETGLALLPGTAFGRPSDELTARLSYVDFDGAFALKNYEKYNSEDEFVAACCPKIKEGIERLIEMINGF